MIKVLNLRLSYLLLAYLLIETARAAGGGDNDLFAMSPAELANVSVTIATGSAKPQAQAAAVTTVITADQIRTMGATELHEVLETVPGIHVSSKAVTHDYLYTMRGMRNDTNAQVLFMLNGTRFSTPHNGTFMSGMEIPVQAIQKIEIIRGPGSALYGADAFAGVINIITKQTGDIDGTTIGIRGGDADTQSIWGQHGTTWQGWEIATSLQFSHNNVDDNRIIRQDAQTLLDQRLNTQASLAPGPMQTQNERWNAHLNLQRKHAKLNFWAFNEVDAGLKAGASGALDNHGTLNGQNYLADVRLSTEDAIADWELQLHASFLYTNTDADIGAFPANALLPIGTNGSVSTTTPRGLVLFPRGMNSFIGTTNKVPTLELTSIYQGVTDHVWRLITGFRYEETTSQEQRNYGAGVLDVFPLPTTSFDMIDVTGTANASLLDRHRSIWSVALQDEWQLAKDWQLTSGLRYDEYSDFGGTLNPRAALVWNINDRLTGKVLYGQAYRAPSFLEQYQQHNQLFIGNPNLQPETIATTELAFDYRPFDSLRTGLNLFHYEIEQLIGGELGTPNPSLTVSNNPGQQAFGSEFEWDWKFLDNWNWKGNYAWQYAYFETTQRRVSNTPEHHVYTALSWNFLPKWHIQTQLNWLGHRLSSPGDKRLLKDYETIDLTLHGKKLFGYVDVTASARNLFDSHGKEPAISLYPDNLPIAGQSFYLEAAVHF